jgi:hypothetical protein
MEISDILNEVGQIVYEKQIPFVKKGLFNFVKMLYEGEDWAGNHSNHFHGITDKTNLCSSTTSNTVRLLLLESDEPQKLVGAKEQIRNIFRADKHSVHINDTHGETLRIAQAVFNKNSVHFLEHAGLDFMENFSRLFELYRVRLCCAEGEDFCIDGSSVLAAYGIRDARDLDFLSHQEHIDFWIDQVNCHNEELPHYPVIRDEIIYNPAYHFYYKGCKFVSLELTEAMKRRRDEEKDRNDVRLIETCCQLRQKQSSVSNSL